MPKNKKRNTNRLKAYYVYCQSGVYTVMASSPNKAGQYVFLATGADDFIIKIEKKRN